MAPTKLGRLALGVGFALAASACVGGGSGAGGDGPTSDVVTEAVATDLTVLREEEKLARDVYRTLYDAWHLPIHQNIASSEETHTTRVRDLLGALGLPDPVKDGTVGVFVDARLGQLFLDLVASGQASEIASLEVGATIEDLDLRDLAEMRAHTTDSRVLATYDSLSCGSRNHLRAYTSQLASRGQVYSPQYVERTQFDAIVSSANEKCGP